MSALTLAQIREGTKRRGFTPADLALLKAHFKGIAKHGLDLDVDPGRAAGEFTTWFESGIVLLQSRQLGLQIALVNLDAGRSLIGTRRTRVVRYTSPLGQDAWQAGPTAGSLFESLFSVTDLYGEASGP